MKRLLCLLLTALLLVFPVASADYEGEPQRCVDVSLACNPSTGYAWLASTQDEEIAAVQDLGTVTAQSDPELVVGSPTAHNFRIIGVSAGEAYFTFAYQRPWESVQPIYYFWLEVSVDDQLNVTVKPELILPGQWEFTNLGFVNVEALEPDEDGNQHFLLTAKEDGFDTLLLYNKEAGLAYEYQVQCEGGKVYIRELSLRWDDGVPFAPEFLFDTTDLDGNPVTEQILAGHSLTILNFWEPWCGPCVNELPALQKLSEEYADKGVQVIGVFSTPDSDEEVRAILNRLGVTYPILHHCSDLDFLQTMYVPTTAIIGPAGNIVKESFAGALDYEGWVKLVDSLL